MKKCLTLFWMAMLASISSAHAYPVTIAHQQGTLELNSQPSKVVVFDLASLDSLDALGVEVTAVARGVWPEYLQKYDGEQYPKVGTLFEPDYEAVQALQPDLIIIAGRSRAAYQKLSHIAPTIDLSIDPAQFVEGVKHNLDLLGQIFNRSDKAKQLITKLDSEVAALQVKGKQSSGLVLFTVRGNVMLHAPGDRFGMLYELTGLRSVVEPMAATTTEEARPQPGSPEAKAAAQAREQRLREAMAKQPDWLIVLDRGAATGGEAEAQKTLAAHGDIAQSSAWQKGQVYYLNPTEWYIVTGGYRSLMKTINQLQQRL
ncbi:ABC transporter substrate-binding protein [Vibrio sp. HDW18]|uniref:siderophore ABC transporter substrate-binding protein n=1 Tax=Vibrio sp. HDW18 TaxID=2714948 RepID=UPI00140E19C2|nr:ABC transporter substrate-binding protein [Vibrio sp. HDW18]QIL85162.1 ABC transporter substrate-binding protein [Vibrio sp. HDW18]